MAARRQKARTRESVSAPDDWKHLLAVGSLVGAVLFTLVLGAALQAGSSLPPPPEDDVASAAASEPPPPAVVTAPAPQPVDRPASGVVAGPAVLDLARRATDDRRRAAQLGERWTLQFMLACDPENVRPRVEALADDPDFLLLPKRHAGRSCFRVCWGLFGTREEALSGRRYPRPLRQITETPEPKRIASLLR